MAEAVQRAAYLADPGEVVLLSPACASFDMFRDYAHRGETFQRAVKESYHMPTDANTDSYCRPWGKL